MEDSRVLNWRRWSAIRKTQVITAAFGFLLTSGMVGFDALQIELPQDVFAWGVFGLGLLLFLPADKLAHALGIESGLGFWGWRVLIISVNTVLAFALGTVLGWLIAVAKHALSRRSK